MGEAILEIHLSAKGKPLKVKLSSVQLGVGRGTTNPSGRTGDRERQPEIPNLTEIVVTREQDVNSQFLSREGLYGGGRPMTIIMYDDKKTPYLILELENTLISNYSVRSSGGQATESLSLNFTKIVYKYDSVHRSENAYRPAYDLSIARGS